MYTSLVSIIPIENKIVNATASIMIKYAVHYKVHILPPETIINFWSSLYLLNLPNKTNYHTSWLLGQTRTTPLKGWHNVAPKRRVSFSMSYLPVWGRKAIRRWWLLIIYEDDVCGPHMNEDVSLQRRKKQGDKSRMTYENQYVCDLTI